jgi:hypothetical protein
MLYQQNLATLPSTVCPRRSSFYVVQDNCCLHLICAFMSMRKFFSRKKTNENWKLIRTSKSWLPNYFWGLRNSCAI